MNEKIKTFIVEVTQDIQVILDVSKFDAAFMAEFDRDIFPADLNDHARHLAQLQARGIVQSNDDYFVEGYGPLRDMGIVLSSEGCATEILSIEETDPNGK